MSEIEWKEIDRSWTRCSHPSTFGYIGGTLETDYAEIRYYTIGDDSDDYPPLYAITEDYGRTVAYEDYEMNGYEVDEDPDMKITDLLEKLKIDSSDYFSYMFERDSLELIVTLKDSEGELVEPSYRWCNGGLKYPIDIESLTASNWRRKLESAFKTAAEDFLNSLRDAKTLEDMYKIARAHSSLWHT